MKDRRTSFPCHSQLTVLRVVKGKSWVVLFLILCVATNFVVTWIAGNRLETLQSQQSSEGDLLVPKQQGNTKPWRKTMAPQESSPTTAGFIHVGKTGGSTISKLLRNGCTSFVAGPCRNITHESIVSKNVEHYYHVPDFHRLPTSKHGTFIISVRDVYERTVSSFLYHHPKNAAVNDLKLNKNHEEYGPLAYSCFDTLDEFATLVNGISNPSDCKYPYRHNVVDASDCGPLACATLHGKIRFFVHLFFNFRNILQTKLPTDPPRRIYVIRQEYLWSDWERLNIMWGQKDRVYIPPSDFNQRNISGLALPVTRSMSPRARELLCQSLQTEYQAYFQILALSLNLDDTDFENSIQIAVKNCPNLNFQSITKDLIRKMHNG